MKNLIRLVSVLAALSIGAFAIANDKKADAKGSCCKADATACCKESKDAKAGEGACCKAEKKADKKQPTK